MKKHNSHIILETNSSQTHKYENDENGNIKVDSDDDSPYNSFIEQNQKLNVKDILIENNNLSKKEFENNILYNEIPSSSNKKKKKKVIKTDLFVKLNDYRFNINKIEPCFNEIDIKYSKDLEPDFSGEIEERKNMSFELDDKKENNLDDKNNKQKKIQRNTMPLLNYGKNTKKFREYKEQEKNKNKIDDNNYKKSNLPFRRNILENDETSNNSNNLNQNNIDENNNVNEEKRREEEKLDEKSSEHSESKINYEENNEQMSLNDKNEYIENQNKNEKEISIDSKIESYRKTEENKGDNEIDNGNIYINNRCSNIYRNNSDKYPIVSYKNNINEYPKNNLLENENNINNENINPIYSSINDQYQYKNNLKEENDENYELEEEIPNPNIPEYINNNSEIYYHNQYNQNNQSDINNSEESSKDKFLNEQEIIQNTEKEIKIIEQNKQINNNNIIKPKINNKYRQKNNFRHTQPYVGDNFKRFKEKNENNAIKIKERKTAPNIKINYNYRKN